jgi:hypothetical protein
VLTSKRFELTALANLLIVLSLSALIARNLPLLIVLEEVARYAHLHLILESTAIFLFAALIWLASRQIRAAHNSHALILGAGFIAVALIDAAHTLSYRGMPDFFGPSDPEKAIYLWLIARAVGAATLLGVATTAPNTWSANRSALVLASGVALGLCLAALALVFQDQFPRTFIEGKGLTAFKIGAELLIALACALASLLLYRRSTRDAGQAGVDLGMLAAAAWVFALTGSFFASYQEVTDVQNMLGHLYKIIACGMLVWAARPLWARKRP